MNPAPSRPAHYGLAAGLTALIALCSVAFTLLVVTPGYQIDDSFIGFRYARNLVEGQGLVFNPGVWVEGYTSFLWVLIAAAGIALGFEPIHWVQGVSILSQVIAIWLTFQIGLRLGRTPLQALVAPAFLGTHITLLTYPMTGMDSMFNAMLITLAVWLYLGGIDRVRSSVLLGIVITLIVLTRFDGFVMMGILLVWGILLDRKLKPLLPAIAIVAGVMLIYNAWRFWVYPQPLPNTFYAKMMFGAERTFLGVAYVGKFLAKSGQYLPLLALVPFALSRPSKRVWMLGWIVVLHLCYVVMVGGDWMPYYRFMLNVLPLLMLLLQEGVWTLRDLGAPALSGRPATRLIAAAGLAMVFLLQAAGLYRETFNGWRPHAHFVGAFNRNIGGGHFDHGAAVLIGQAIEERVPADWVIATEWAGVIPSQFHQQALDILALNDAEMVQYGLEHGFPTSTVGMFPTADYIASRRPHIVVPIAALRDTPEEAIEAAVGRIHKFETVSKGGSWIVSLYGGLANEHGYELNTMRIGDEYWAFLLRGDLAWPPPSAPPSVPR